MPYELRIADQGLGVLLIGKGLMTGSEMLKTLLQLNANRELMAGLAYSLSDFTQVENIDISSDDIQAIASAGKQASLIAPHHLSVIAAPQPVIFGLSRMYKALISATSWDVGVFRTLATAKDYIRQKTGMENLTFE